LGFNPFIIEHGSATLALAGTPLGASLQVREAVLRAETALLHLPEDKIFDRIYRIDRILELKKENRFPCLVLIVRCPF